MEIEIHVFLNWIIGLEEYFTWRQLKGHSCKDYAKRQLLGDAQAWWKEVECQLYQYPPTWNEMKLLLEDKYVHGRDPFSPPVEANLKPIGHFAQYLSLTQGKLSVEQYANEFERRHYLCDLGKTLDFNQFLKGLRPSILKNMKKECKYMHEAFWEAIRVEHSLKRYRLRKGKMQEEKSPQTTEVPMVEIVMENIKADIDKQDQRKEDAMNKLDDTSYSTPKMNDTSRVLEDKEPNIPFVDKADQNMQAPKVVEANIEDLDMVNKENERPMDPIEVLPSDMPIGSSENKSIIPNRSEENPLVEVSHINFIFGEQQWKLGTYNLILQILQSCFQVKSDHLMKQRLKLTWNTRMSDAFMSCNLYEGQAKHRRFVRLIFDPGNHLLNSRMSSLQEGGN